MSPSFLRRGLRQRRGIVSRERDISGRADVSIDEDVTSSLHGNPTSLLVIAIGLVTVMSLFFAGLLALNIDCPGSTGFTAGVCPVDLTMSLLTSHVLLSGSSSKLPVVPLGARAFTGEIPGSRGRGPRLAALAGARPAPDGASNERILIDQTTTLPALNFGPKYRSHIVRRHCLVGGR
jgi:hypothetical protein